MTGRALQLNVKPRVPGQFGLPKHPVPAAHIRPEGMEGDFNDWRTANLPGDRKQAILLLTTEILDQLRQEGWPVAPGDLGENITLDGIPESALAAGMQVAVGEALLEVTEPCDPCTRLYTLPYVGDARGPAFLRATAGRRGWYARVLHPGTVSQGAAVKILEPGAPPA